jgi:hypothetical protein
MGTPSLAPLNVFIDSDGPVADFDEALKKSGLEADVFKHLPGISLYLKITQGAGRSVRSSEDYATTYMLDSGIQRLWTAKNNEWADEFRTSFASTLGSDD